MNRHDASVFLVFLRSYRVRPVRASRIVVRPTKTTAVREFCSNKSINNDETVQDTVPMPWPHACTLTKGTVSIGVSCRLHPLSTPLLIVRLIFLSSHARR